MWSFRRLSYLDNYLQARPQVEYRSWRTCLKCFRNLAKNNTCHSFVNNFFCPRCKNWLYPKNWLIQKLIKLSFQRYIETFYLNFFLVDFKFYRTRSRIRWNTRLSAWSSLLFCICQWYAGKSGLQPWPICWWFHASRLWRYHGQSNSKPTKEYTGNRKLFFSQLCNHSPWQMCEVIIISKQRFIGPLPKIEMNGQCIIAVVKASKCLGITIDQELSWEAHVSLHQRTLVERLKKQFQMRSLPAYTISTIYHQLSWQDSIKYISEPLVLSTRSRNLFQTTLYCNTLAGVHWQPTTRDLYLVKHRRSLTTCPHRYMI